MWFCRFAVQIVGLAIVSVILSMFVLIEALVVFGPHPRLLGSFCTILLLLSGSMALFNKIRHRFVVGNTSKKSLHWVIVGRKEAKRGKRVKYYYV